VTVTGRDRYRWRTSLTLPPSQAESAGRDELPREWYLRRAGGYYYLYGQTAFDQVLGTHLAGVAEWEARLAARGRPVRRRKRPPPAAPLHADRTVAACR